MDAADAFSPPPIAFLHLELPRVLGEAAALPWAGRLMRLSPKGDGHPVVVLPGFLGSDRATKLMRRKLISQGYDARPWTLGRNLGPTSIGHEGEHLAERIEDVFRETGRKVSLVGWSLGGIMAREVAKEAPEMVRQVITLGSPFGGSPSSSRLAEVYRRVTGEETDTPEFAHMIRDMKAPPPRVPSTAIFSRSDGIVNWRTCVERPAPWTDNIEVVSSHCGLVVNPVVLCALADRLALPEGRWTPFERGGDPLRSILFPTSGHCYDVC